MGFLSNLIEKITNTEEEYKPRPKIKQSDIVTHYFYRNLGGKYQYTQNDPEKVKFSFINKAEKTVFCKVHSKWEKCGMKDGKVYAACGNIQNSFLINYEEIELPKPEGNSFLNEETGEMETIPPTEKEIEEYRTENWERMIYACRDENKICKDLLFVRIVENFTLDQIYIELTFLNRAKVYNKHSAPFINLNSFIKVDYTYDIKKNIVSEHQSEQRTFTEATSRWNNTILDISENLPTEIFDFIGEKIKHLIRKNWGANLNIEFYERNKSTFAAYVKYPFEPNLYEVASMLNLDIGRFDMNGYNYVCEKLGFKSPKSLRKLYMKNPKALIAYKGLIDCGFKDINLIQKVLSGVCYPLFYWSEYDETDRHYITTFYALKLFCQKAISVRGEGPTLTMLCHNYKDVLNFEEQQRNSFDDRYFYSDIIFDSAKMFVRYCEQEDFPKEIFDSFMKTGLSKNNHDIITEYDFMQHNKNIAFKYLNKQKDFEDRIDDYEFKLPKDSYTLVKIGTELHNCVASYTDRVLEKACTIVYVEKNGVLKMCIEVRDYKHVWQQRADFNLDPKGEDAKVMEKWRNKHKLSFNGNSY